MQILIEVLEFMLKGKKYLLYQIFLISLLLGGLIILSQNSAVAPFIYTIF
ncbi:DUF5989 family protein [Pelagibacteraceae bacterium]|nr:DUF5989 family protein [Pelagibacteraceae bacterium]